MFAIDDETEALFLKGWPHLRQLASPHPHEQDAAKWARKALEAYDPNVYHVVWPREVAYRFVRAVGALRKPDVGDNIVFPDEDDVTRRLAIAGPVDEREARALVAQVTHPRSVHGEPTIRDLLFLLEAMVGTEPVLDAALSRYEEMSDAELGCSNPHDISEVAYWLGFLLHRLPQAAAAKHRARIVRLVEKRPPCAPIERFRQVIGGVKGIEESGWAAGIHIGHFVGDPKFLLEYADTGGDELDMQIAFQGGEKVLAAFEKRLRGVSAWRLPFLVDELSRVASPRATKMLKALSSKRAVAAQVERVLAARAGGKGAGASAKPRSAKPVVKKGAAPKKQKPLSRRELVAQAELRFEELSAWLAKELGKVRGKKKQEAKLFDEATSRYADIRTDLGEDPTEAVVHFFAADGCGYGKHRDPAFLRLDPTDEELERWVAAIS